MASEEFNAAIVLAAGKGKRMGTYTPKQYLHLFGHPLIWYSLREFETHPQVQMVVLVCGPEDAAYCREHIIEPYKFHKVTAIVPGGNERYDSVWNAMQEIRRQEENGQIPKCSNVMVHDGARPLISAKILDRCLEGARKYGACAAGMPAKDTIKICEQDGTVVQTPDRAGLWTVQTPQTFRFDLLYEAYCRLYENMPEGITDDAMVIEKMTDHKVRMVEGAYRNIKITTPEDMALARIYMTNENDNITFRLHETGPEK